MKQKVINKRISTNEPGIFYKEIINTSTNKVIDKIFIIRYREDGKDHLVTVGKYSQGIRVAYCKQKRNEILNKINLGEEPPLIVAKKKKKIITFDEIAQQNFKQKIGRNKTIKNDISRYNKHIKDYIGHKDIYKITASDIENIQNDKLSQVSKTTINHVTTLIKTIFNYAIKKNIFKGPNPANNIEKFSINNERIRFLNIEEIELLLETIKHNELLTLFVVFSLSTGARLEDVLSVQKKDIDLVNDIVTLSDNKKKEDDSTYTGFINKQLKVLLKKRLIDLNPNDYVVSTHTHKIDPTTIQVKLRKIMNELFNKNLDKNDRKNRVVVHTLRHTFASHLAIQGTSIYIIKKLMNHSDIKSTMRYAKLNNESGKINVKNLYNKESYENI